MTGLKLTSHCIQQFYSRSGYLIEPDCKTLWTCLHDGVIMSYKSVIDMGFRILKHSKGDHYIVWNNPILKEPMCAVIRKDGAVVTVMTRNIYSRYTQGKKIRSDINSIKGVTENGKRDYCN